MRIFRFTLGLALTVLLASATASAAVKWPYQLDPAFSSNGYDTLDEGAAQKLVMLDGDTIVAVAKPQTDAGILGHPGIRIDVFRYDSNGQIKPWTHFSDGPSPYVRLQGVSGSFQLEAVRDIGVSAAGNIYLLVDIRLQDQHDMVPTLYVLNPTTGYRSSGYLVMQDVANVNDIGVQMTLSGNRLLALISHQKFATDDAFVADGNTLEIRAFNLLPNGDFELDYTWGANGAYTNGRTYSYDHCGLGGPIGGTLNQPCRITGSHFIKAPDGALYVAGAVQPVINFDNDVFLLKLDANGDVMTSHGVDGWAINGVSDIEEIPGGLVTRVTGITVKPGPIFLYQYDVFLLSAMQRACGEGLIVYQFSSEGVYTHRTYTYGGGGDAVTLCASIRARDMAVITDGPIGINQLAIVGEYLGKPAFENDPQGHAAMLLTVDADNLPVSQTLQLILGGEVAAYAPWYGFRAVRYDTDSKRLIVVGDGVQSSQYGDFDVALTARLRPDKLFVDGFEN